MSEKTLELTLVEAGVTARATMFTDLAPETCRILGEALKTPVTVKTVHAMFAGPEIMTGLPAEAQAFDPTAIPNENQTCFPGAGEILWYYQGRNAMKGLPEELWEIGIFYGTGGRTFGPLGWTPVNIFAQITDGLEAFAEAAAATRTEGLKTLRIECK